jgi:hypothetical protein
MRHRVNKTTIATALMAECAICFNCSKIQCVDCLVKPDLVLPDRN